MKMDIEEHKQLQTPREDNKKSEKALSQAFFSKKPVISFSVLRARKKQVFNLLFYFKTPSNSLFAGIMQFTKIFKQSQTLFYLAKMAIKLSTKTFITCNKHIDIFLHL